MAGRGGGGAAPAPKQDELQPHPVKDQLPNVSYCITSPPPWREFFHIFLCLMQWKFHHQSELFGVFWFAGNCDCFVASKSTYFFLHGHIFSYLIILYAVHESSKNVLLSIY